MAADTDPGTSSWTQKQNIIAIETDLGEDALLLTDLDGEEALSRCFVYVVRFITKASDEAVQGLLGKPATLWLCNNDEELRRPINGRIRRITEIPSESALRGFAAYKAEIVPALWFLDCTADCRIFMGQTVPDIVKTVLQDFGIDDFVLHLLKTDYPVLDYCVQYRESALAFVSRLMEEVGIFWYHAHEAKRHVLTMLDNNNLAPQLPGDPFRIAIASDQGTLESFRSDSLFRTGHWTLSDYDFEAPSKVMPQAVKMADGTMADYETFDFPGRFTEQPVGKWLTRLRLEAEETATRRYSGAGTVAAFGPGQRVKIGRSSGEPTDYLLTEVRHRARAGGYTNTEAESSYANSFAAIPFATQFRPPLLTPKPILNGLQTATVVSATAGDPIQTDIYGRIKVHFHWDRRGKPSSGDTSCWLRVSQFNTGSHWGSISVPHAGQEVVVGFLEGDPDRPLVLGRVHNAEKMPPLVLPADKHKTVIRDHGNNRMIMRGQAGKEHMTLVSPRRVNFVAAPEPAKPLSAGSSSTSQATVGATSDTFGTTSIDGFKDKNSLDEMVGIYNAMMSATQTDTAIGNAVGSLTSAGVLYGSAGPDTGAEGDINGYAQNNMNALCLNNMNDWVGANYSEWVAGNYYELVKLSANTTILGNNTTTIGQSTSPSGVVNSTFVWGTNFTNVTGPNITTVEGDNTSANGGAVNTFNLVGPITTVNLGIVNATANFAPTFTLNVGPNMTFNDFKLDETGTRIDNIETHVDAVTESLIETLTAVSNAGIDVKDADTVLTNAGIMVFA